MKVKRQSVTHMNVSAIGNMTGDKVYHCSFFSLLKFKNQFNDHTRAKIIAEMHRISVQFHFWQDQGTQNWAYTSLMGNLLRVGSFRQIFHEILHYVDQ